jgi:hypothetical protein
MAVALQTSRLRRAALALALVLPLVLAVGLLAQQAQAPALSAPEQVAEGVWLHRWSDPDLLAPPGPVAVHLLRLDPRRVDLRLALASDGDPAKATVQDIARRHGALAAVNAGFFVVATGAPAGLLKAGKRLVSSAALPRGAVGIQGRTRLRPLRLIFDQVSANRPAAGQPAVEYAPRRGTDPSAWAGASDIVGGAGLLVHKGRALAADDWAIEKLRPGFTTERHPRTMIGVDESGDIWLVAVDGRNPLVSLGMTFTELQALARRLSLRQALNLDGGGSTTMVVRGAVVNHPSDPIGPRPVSDALLVFAR